MKRLPLCMSVSLVTLIGVRAQAQQNDSSLHEDVLALHRIELRPYGGWAGVPNSVTGAFVGMDVAFRLSRFLALGVDVAWYAPFERSAGADPSYPLNETRWSGDLDAYIIPWPARARAGAETGAFEPYLLGGLGALRSRPIAVVDPTVRHFDDTTHVDLSIGAGVRVFVGARVAFTLEVRDLVYFERIENSLVGGGQGSIGVPPDTPDTWYAPNTRFTQAIQIRLGASFFVLGG